MDPYTGEEYPGMVEKTWDIVTMTVSHYDELVFYLWPVNGYKVIAGSADKVRISLYKYVNGERVPYIDNFGNPVVLQCQRRSATTKPTPTIEGSPCRWA